MAEPLSAYKSLTKEREEEIASLNFEIARLRMENTNATDQVERHKSLYSAALKTIADRDALIAHLRDQYNLFRDLINCRNFVAAHRSCFCEHCERLADKAKEPTP